MGIAGHQQSSKFPAGVHLSAEEGAKQHPGAPAEYTDSVQILFQILAQVWEGCGGRGVPNVHRHPLQAVLCELQVVHEISHGVEGVWGFFFFTTFLHSSSLVC